AAEARAVRRRAALHHTPIRNLVGVATDLGLLTRDDDGVLEVAGVICASGGEAAALAAISERCGRAMPAAASMTRFDPPTRDELELLRAFDPTRAILA
ncbi:MAG: hypothetical protein RLO21_05105, partial [Nitratireductor sp.]